MFFAEKLEILGHMIDQDGLHPAPQKGSFNNGLDKT